MSDLFGEATHPEEPGETPEPSRRSRRNSREQQARRRRKHRRRSALALVLVLAVVGGGGYGLSRVFGNVFSSSGSDSPVRDYPGPGTGEVQVTVAAGDTGSAIGRTLVDAGVVATLGAFTDAYANNSQATRIQPGTYALAQQMSAADAVNALLDPASRVSYRVTIPEGYTAAQIYDRIYEVTAIPVEDLVAATQDVSAIGLPAEANGSVEGWLYPATYEVEPDATAASVLAQMVAKTVAVLAERDVAQDQWETVLIKASIVEREGKRDEDRAKIARAIENRLAVSMPLQVDATVLYGIGVTGRSPSAAELADESNVYNTYKHNGLPPTPIASPGLASIDAVLAPAEGDWLFWVTVNPDTGETKFAATYDQHQEYVNELRQWEAANG